MQSNSTIIHLFWLHFNQFPSFNESFSEKHFHIFTAEHWMSENWKILMLEIAAQYLNFPAFHCPGKASLARTKSEKNVNINSWNGTKWSTWMHSRSGRSKNQWHSIFISLPSLVTCVLESVKPWIIQFLMSQTTLIWC